VARRARFIGIALIFSFLVFSLGCSSSTKTGGGGGGGQSGLHFTAPLQAPSVDPGGSVTLTVNESVNWSLQSGFGPPIGMLSNPSSTGVTYTAPGTITSVTQVSVVATLQSDSTQSASLPVTINLAPSVSGALSRNTSCQYDPIIPVGVADGVAGAVFGARGNPPTVQGGTPPFTWSVGSGSLPPGLTLNAAPSTTSSYLFGTPSAPGCSQVTVQVTDATGATATTGTSYIIIAPPSLASQSPNLVAAYFNVPYPPIAVSFSGGTPPYRNLRLNPLGDQMPPGLTLTVDPNNPGRGIVSGAPTISVIGGMAFNPTIQVEDSQTPNPAIGQVGLGFFVSPVLPANACVPTQGFNTNLAGMKGQYAFLLRGFDANGPVVMAGSFAADGGGNITGGVEDVMRSTGSQTGVQLSGGSYTLLGESDNSNDAFEQSGCLLLTTSTGTTTFALSMGGCTTGSDLNSGFCVADAQGVEGLYTSGRLIESDDSTGAGTRASGIVRLQDSSSFAGGLTGHYAFGLSGWDVSGGRLAAAGSFSAGSGALTSVAADVNDGGTFQGALSGGTGSFSAMDATTGRGTLSMSVGTSTLSSVAAYAVSATEVILADTGSPGAANPTVGGEAIRTSGSFGQASLQSSYTFHAAGLSAPGPDPSIGILKFDGVGGFSGTQYEDQAGTISTTALSGAYSVDGNSGRLMLSAPSLGQNVGDHPLIGYLIPLPTTLTQQGCVKLASCVAAFLVSTDATAQAGQMEFQTPMVAPPPPFSRQFVAGYFFFGSDESMDAATAVLAGTVKANPNGGRFAGVESASYPNAVYCQVPNCVLLLPNEAFGGGYSVNSDGSGTVGGQTVSVTNGNVTFYIDESPLNSHPAVIVVEQ